MKKLRYLLSIFLMGILGGVNVYGETNIDFSQGLPSEWTKSSGTAANQTYANKSCLQLQKTTQIESPAFDFAVSSIKINLTRSGKGTTFTVSYQLDGSTDIVKIKEFTSTEVKQSNWEDFVITIPEAAQVSKCKFIFYSTASSYYISNITLTSAEVSNKCSAPTFDPKDGTTFTDNLLVKASTSTTGAKIVYTTDATEEPITDFPESGLQITETTTIRAKAIDPNNVLEASDIVAVTYTKKEPSIYFYRKITSQDEIVDGGVYLITSDANNVALGEITTDNTRGTAVTFNPTGDIYDGDVNIENAPYETTFIQNGTKFYLKTIQGFISCVNDATDITVNETESENSLWDITNKGTYIEIKGNQGSRMLAANGSSMFRYYATNNSTYQNACLYRKSGSFAIGTEGFATFYSKDAYIMPDGVEGGIITAADNTNSTLTIDYKYKAGETVPAKTALLLKGEAKTYTYAYTTQEGTPAEGNLLHGADAVDADGKTYVEGTGVKYYILSHNQAGTDFGFYWAAAEGAAIEYQAPYAFLAIGTNGSSAAPKMFSLGGDGDTSGISNIETETTTANGKIFTVTGAYAGNDINRLPKGIYIKNGKKVVVRK